MFRCGGGGGGRGKTVAGSTSTGAELPVDGAVRVTKVDRIQAYNLVSRPSVHHAIAPATSGPAESLAVSVVRVGDVVDEAVRVTKEWTGSRLTISSPGHRCTTPSRRRRRGRRRAWPSVLSG
uniref:Uncharacterized protein n=1 Tax=Aegilops tauschii subsp. strangulata TaxID=200361 RepID=A0A452XXY4_AEGTS